MDKQRRTFMFVATAAGLGVAGVPSAFAQKPLPMLDEADATAKALGYVANNKKVDVKKHPNFKPDQKCTNCTLYAGKATDKAAACPLFQGKLVAGDGWCISWAKKAKA